MFVLSEQGFQSVSDPAGRAANAARQIDEQRMIVIDDNPPLLRSQFLGSGAVAGKQIY